MSVSPPGPVSSQKRPVWASVLTLLMGIASIQGGAALAKQIFPWVGAMGATCLRLVFASAILVVVWRPWRERVSWADLRWLIAYGACLGIMNLLFYQAIARIPLGIAVALEFVGPLAVALSASRRATDFGWAVLAAIGIYMLAPLTAASSALPSSQIDPLGAGLALAAGVAWAGYIVFGHRSGSRVSAGFASSVGMVVATLVAAPFGIAELSSHLHSLDAPSYLWPLAVGVALLSSAIPYSLEMVALQNLPAKNFGILMSLEPAVAALAGLGFLHEHLSPVQWAAIGCIILASGGSAGSVNSGPAKPTDAIAT